MKGVTRPEVSREVVRFLSDDERTALLKASRESYSADLYPFVLFALTTGTRKGEIAALQWANVDSKRRWAIFPRTKNGTSRGVPLTETVCALLKARKRDGARVFPIDITKAWHTATARAGIVNFRFHDLPDARATPPPGAITASRRPPTTPSSRRSGQIATCYAAPDCAVGALDFLSFRRACGLRLRPDRPERSD